MDGLSFLKDGKVLGGKMGGHALAHAWSALGGGRKPAGIGEILRVPREGWLLAIERSGVGPGLSLAFQI